MYVYCIYRVNNIGKQRLNSEKDIHKFDRDRKYEVWNQWAL
jgi:hypothetical protein